MLGLASVISTDNRSTSRGRPYHQPQTVKINANVHKTTIRLLQLKLGDACLLSASRTNLIRAQARRQQRWKDCGGERNQSMACHCGALQARGEAIGRKKDKLQPLSGKKNSFFRSMASPLEKPQPDQRDMIFRLTDKAHTPIASLS